MARQGSQGPTAFWKKQERLFVITLLSAGAGRVRDQMLFPESSKGNDGVMVDDGAPQLYSCVLGA